MKTERYELELFDGKEWLEEGLAADTGYDLDYKSKEAAEKQAALYGEHYETRIVKVTREIV